MTEIILGILGAILGLLGLGYFKKTKNHKQIQEEKSVQKKHDETIEKLEETIDKIEQEDTTLEETNDYFNDIDLNKQ